MKTLFNPKGISRSGADIFLYGKIEDSGAINAATFAAELRVAESMFSSINVHISSPGGSIFEGLAIYNLIKQSKSFVSTYNDGLAASMGSVLLMSGKKVHMAKGARLMIHEPRWGDEHATSDELRRMADQMDSLRDDIATIYANRTGMAKQWIIDNWMSNGKDNWFDASQAKSNKLIDEIFDSSVSAPTQYSRDVRSIAAFYDEQLQLPMSKELSIPFQFLSNRRAEQGVDDQQSHVDWSTVMAGYDRYVELWKSGKLEKLKNDSPQKYEHLLSCFKQYKKAS